MDFLRTPFKENIRKSLVIVLLSTSLLENKVESENHFKKDEIGPAK